MSRVLVFSRTTDYRHESIEHTVEVVRVLLEADGHEVTHTEDASAFTTAGLAPYALTVWVSVTGDVLDEQQRGVVARWLHAGGAWAGVHGATLAEPSWPEFERIAGAVFSGHPDLQPATVHVADPTHPSTAGLPVEWQHTDEWYEFRRPPTDRTVLLTVDEATYTGGAMGPDHPIAWHGPYGRGRTWYTALGHEVEAFDGPLLREHLRGGLRSLLT